jgi:nicotinamidase-related amidase
MPQCESSLNYNRSVDRGFPPYEIDSKETKMATIRESKNSALVVVDVQVGVMNNAWDAERVIGNVALAVERARAQGVPVIWVQHSDAELVHGSAEWQWVPALVPRADEPRVYKQFECSFEKTTLEDELAKRGVSHIVLAGAATNWCIRATAYGALDRGYDLTLVKDAHTTKSMTLDDGFTIEAESVVRELNVVMTWLSYPGRKCGTATADQVSFSPV